VAPPAIVVKKTPDITDIIDVRSEKRETVEIPQPNIEKKTTEEEFQPNIEEKTTEVELKPNVEPNMEFPAHWRTLFEQIFSSVPTVYFSLKESLPEIENNIIKVIVKNEIQKEHFEAKIRDVLEYLRTHFDEKIDDIVVETNEKLETKKIIYDVKDKLQNFKEQNEEFEDFLQILDLKIKD